MCYQATMVHDKCHCVYSQRPVQPCQLHGKPGHIVDVKSLSVEYPCKTHPGPGDVSFAVGLFRRQADLESCEEHLRHAEEQKAAKSALGSTQHQELHGQSSRGIRAGGLRVENRYTTNRNNGGGGKLPQVIERSEQDKRVESRPTPGADITRNTYKYLAAELGAIHSWGT
ncbi:hypothetical protein LZ31DRAFT_633718 [Colletotrichum somersetense]|nr:hypothetical protein LZ31DRAFT_633718 [Colletotrichum somersetense]